MREIDLGTITVYKFNELSPEAKRKALADHIHINTDYEWWDGIETLLEPTNEKLKAAMSDEQYASFVEKGRCFFEYSGFYFDLGRGESLEFKDLALKDPHHEAVFLEMLGLPGELIDFVDMKFSNDGCRNSSSTLEIEFNGDPCGAEGGGYACDECEAKYQGKIDDAVDGFKEMVRSAWRDLQSDYEYRISDEAIKESLVVNEYEFTADGVLYSE